MKYLKLCLTFLALGLFVIACTQTTPTNSNTNSLRNTTTNGNTVINVSNSSVNNSNANSNVADANNSSTELAASKKLYSTTCARCHQEDGTGGKTTIEGREINAENLTTDKLKNMADAKYVEYIKNGVPDEGMPAFKDRLSDEQINGLIKFIRTEFQGK